MNRLVIEVRAVAIDFGYWIRPYDMIRDARRWRWQRRGRCGRVVWAALPAEARDAVVKAVERRLGGGAE